MLERGDVLKRPKNFAINLFGQEKMGKFRRVKTKVCKLNDLSFRIDC